MSSPKRLGEPTLTIVAEQPYDNGLALTFHVQVDLVTLLAAKNPRDILATAVYTALANIGVRQ